MADTGTTDEADQSAANTDKSQQDSDARFSKQHILDVQIREGLAELNRPASGLFLSALSAGLDIGFGPLLMAVMLTVAEFSFASPLTRELLMANAYAVGFVLVILGRSELFTEHTTLAVLPVLDGQASVRQLARLWGLVYLGNVLGAIVFAGIIAVVIPAMSVAETRAFVEIASRLTDHDWEVIVAGGVLAGWLMGLLSWLVAAAQETTSRLLFVWIIATAIGFAHLPHSIAGTVEVLMGAFSSAEITFVDFTRFLVASTIGNAIGGAVFVSILKYSHVVRSVPEDEMVQ